jgi:Tol biopolymer transport system component
MSWSPDGEWLGYTVVADSGRDHLRAGWLFDPSAAGDEAYGTKDPADFRRSSAPPIYQIWASHRNQELSVLIEESSWPLTAPSWSPRAKSIAFGRFASRPAGPNDSGRRGRFEVVIQDAMNRRHVVWSSSDFELDDETRARIPRLDVAWSPDGRFLAFPQPGRRPSILIAAVDSGKVLVALENASRPVWSRDGSQCAFVRVLADSNSLGRVERHGQSFTPPKPVLGMGSVKSAPIWSNDGQSIFSVSEKLTTRSRELVLERLSARGGDSARILSLLSEPGTRSGLVRSVAIAFDRDGERCFFSPDILGREHELGMAIVLEQHINKKFPPIDGGLRIDSLALSPDDRYLAMRFGSPDSLSPPAVYDLTLEQLGLVVPDETSRRQWLDSFVEASRDLLISGLPRVTADGQPGGRPTLLPLPGELPATETINLRLIKIAKKALPLCDQGAGQREDRDKGGADRLRTESHLFFAYLLGEFGSAISDLDALDSRITSPDDRLSLLSLRAQILWFRGEHAEARSIIDYLIDVGGRYTRRAEDTPSGLTLTVDASPRQVWTRYLSARAAESLAKRTNPQVEMPTDVLEIPLQNPFAPADARLIERGLNAPFAPKF